MKICTINEKGECFNFGSGFFISKDGILVTNFHVLNYLQLNHWFHIFDGNQFSFKEAHLLGCSDDRNIDLCFLFLPEFKGNYFELWTGETPLGQTVYKIGNAHHDFHLATGKTLERNINVHFLLQGRTHDNRQVQFIEISVPINPGDSGGPIIDSFGNAVGMSTLKIFQSGMMTTRTKRYALSASEIKRRWPKKKNSLGQLALLDKRLVEELKQNYLVTNGPPSKIPLGEVVNTMQVRKLILENLVILVDIRSPMNFFVDHLPHAHSVPYTEHSEPKRDFLMAKDQFSIEALRTLLQQNPNKKLLIYGQNTGSWDAYKAVETARVKGGMENILWYREGIDAWKKYLQSADSETNAPSVQGAAKK